MWIWQVLLFTGRFGCDIEPLREYIRFYIYTRYKLGFRARPDHEELVTVYGDLSSSFCVVARWIEDFSDGRKSVEDEARACWKATDVCDRQFWERAEALIVEDPSITLRFLALELGVSYGSGHAIVQEQFGLSKNCARWVPHRLTTEQKEQRVAICQRWFQ